MLNFRGVTHSHGDASVNFMREIHRAVLNNIGFNKHFGMMEKMQIFDDLINISDSAGLCSSINMYHFRFDQPKLVEVPHFERFMSQDCHFLFLKQLI